MVLSIVCIVSLINVESNPIFDDKPFHTAKGIESFHFQKARKNDYNEFQLLSDFSEGLKATTAWARHWFLVSEIEA